MSTDIDNSTQTQDDERQHDQQSNQVAVKNTFPITIEIPLMVHVQDHGADPPEEKTPAGCQLILTSWNLSGSILL